MLRPNRGFHVNTVCIYLIPARGRARELTRDTLLAVKMPGRTFWVAAPAGPFQFKKVIGTPPEPFCDGRGCIFNLFNNIL
jgi:hypothetical protein